jgi:diguanylate cyclase (GGDEF)-like protein
MAGATKDQPGLPRVRYADDDEQRPERTEIVPRSSPLPRPELRTERACLVVIAGDSVGDVFTLDADGAVIGRGDEARIRIDDTGISRHHARVSVAGGQVRIEDLGSANGTWVNGERVETRLLRDGDKVEVGSTTILKFTFQDQLDEAFQRNLLEAARRDGLTRAFTKAYFLEQLEREVSFANRHGSPLSLLMIDVDHFKEINDALGHLAGDAVLSHLAHALRDDLRAEDLLCRYGGEEFAVLCRGSGIDQAAALAERLRARVERARFPIARSEPVTISVGVAEHRAGAGAEALIAAADARLYEAKRSGRNRVVARS